MSRQRFLAAPIFIAALLLHSASSSLAAAPAARTAPTRGIVSNDAENEASEPDPKFEPKIVRFKERAGMSGNKATGSAASSGGKVQIKDHPKAQEYAKKL